MTPQPGDLFFSRGRGLQGWVIRRASRSAVAHCGVLVRELEPGLWRTHEAFGGDGPYGGGSGLRERVRPLDDEPLQVVRPWRTAHERDLGLLRSHQLLDQGYDWGEITRESAPPAAAAAAGGAAVAPRPAHLLQPLRGGGARRTPRRRAAAPAGPDLARAAARGAAAGQPAGQPVLNRTRAPGGSCPARSRWCAATHAMTG